MTYGFIREPLTREPIDFLSEQERRSPTLMPIQIVSPPLLDSCNQPLQFGDLVIMNEDAAEIVRFKYATVCSMQNKYSAIEHAQGSFTNRLIRVNVDGQVFHIQSRGITKVAPQEPVNQEQT